MNLHQIVAGAIGTISPTVLGSIQVSTGYTQAADYTQIPSYASRVTGVPMDVQPVSSADLRHIEGLNLNGTLRSIWVNGVLNDVSRPQVKGGDLITLPSGSNAGVWLVNQVVEQWDTWVHVICTLQND